MERLHQSHRETFKKYQEDTQKNLVEALLEWKLKFILHAQVVVSPLNLSKVDFDCLKDIFVESLSFDVYNLEGKELKAFQKEWKKSVVFSTLTMPD